MKKSNSNGSVSKKVKEGSLKKSGNKKQDIRNSSKEEQIEEVEDVEEVVKNNEDDTKGIGKITFAVHRSTFVEYMPEGVVAMCWHSTEKLLAVARENGDIEVWNGTFKNKWFIVRKFNGIPDMIPRSVLWVGDRLFTCSLNGMISEWSFETMKLKYSEESLGGAAWAMALHPNKQILAVACEDGTLRTFDASTDRLILQKSFPTKSRRLLSVAWSKDGKYIFTGSEDGIINKWDAVAHKIDLVITTDRKNIIWALSILSDMTVISGDSSGHTNFWDGQYGTLIQKFKKNLADVLTIAVTDDEDMVVSSGTENKIAVFKPKNKSKKEWTSDNVVDRKHTHDIKSIVYKNGCFVSGGVDTIMYVCDKSFNLECKLSPFPPHSKISFSRSTRMLLCMYSKKLELWKLGQATAPFEVKDHNFLKISEYHSLLLQLKLQGNNLVCSQLSPDGRFILVSDSNSTKFFKLDFDQSRVSVNKIKFKCEASVSVCFSSDSKLFAVGTTTKKVNIYSVNEELGDGHCNPKQLKSFDFKCYDEEKTPVFKSVPISSLMFDTNNENVICSGGNSLQLFNVNNEKTKILPPLDSPINVFNIINDDIAIITYSQRLYFYQTNIEKLDEIPERSCINLSHTKMSNNLTGICVHPTEKNIALVWGENSFKYMSVHKDEKKGVIKCKSKQTCFNIQPILRLDFINDKELVAVERPWAHVTAQLPDVIYRHRYGT